MISFPGLPDTTGPRLTVGEVAEYVFGPIEGALGNVVGITFVYGPQVFNHTCLAGVSLVRGFADLVKVSFTPLR